MICGDDVVVKYVKLKTRGCVSVADCLLGNKIIYINSGLCSSQFEETLIHEMAHLQQLGRFSKRTLHFLHDYHKDINFHDEAFWRIYHKLKIRGVYSNGKV